MFTPTPATAVDAGPGRNVLKEGSVGSDRPIGIVVSLAPCVTVPVKRVAPFASRAL